MQLAARIADLHAAGATYADLAQALDVTKAAVRARLQRHGYRSTPPSMPRYTGRRIGQVS